MIVGRVVDLEGGKPRVEPLPRRPPNQQRQIDAFMESLGAYRAHKTKETWEALMDAMTRIEI